MGKLDREKILEAALALVDREGLGKLSMRRLGRALGVEAMALYRYVRSKDELLNGVHEMVLAGVDLPPPTDDWRADAAAFARAFRAALLAHPRALPLFASRPAITPGSLEILEAALAIAERAGLGPLASIQAVQALNAFVVGHTLFHSAPLPASAAGLDYASLPIERFPRLRRALVSDAEAEFEAGLAIWLRGIG